MQDFMTQLSGYI